MHATTTRRLRTSLQRAALAGAALALTLPATAATAQDTARVHLIHGIPDTDVDVAVDGAVVFAGFSFGDRQDLSSFAGQTLSNVEVLLAGTDTVAIDIGDFAVPASGNYSAIAHLTADGTPTVGVFANDTSTLDAGEGRLVVRHTAAAPAVDVLADGAVAFAGVTNPNEGAVDLPAGTISASVVPAGASEPVVIGPADLSITAGSSLIVYAVGSLDADSLTVVTESITGLGGAPAVVDTGNSLVSATAVETSAIPMIAMAAMLSILLIGGVRRLQKQSS